MEAGQDEHENIMEKNYNELQTCWKTENLSANHILCPTQLLKYSCDIISPVLSDILTASVTLGSRKLKMSKIIPICKADDETDASNLDQFHYCQIVNFKCFILHIYFPHIMEMVVN